MKMNKRIKKLWLRALRSGKYKRAVGRLKNTKNGYCCLGVLCDLFAKETGEGEWDDNNTFNSDLFVESSFLPDVVINWADLPSNNPDLGDTTCSTVNDRRGATHKKTANLIQKYL